MEHVGSTDEWLSGQLDVLFLSGGTKAMLTCWAYDLIRAVSGCPSRVRTMLA